MNDYNEKTKLLYKVLSRIYDLMDFFLFPAGRANPRKGLASHLPDESIRVLDVCCGTGNSSFAIAAKNPHNYITGIDLSADMLRVARRKAAKRNSGQLTFLEMDATKMSFASGSFDAVTVSLALHEMPQELICAILAEMNRVVRPGGRLFIIDWERPKHPAASAVFSVFPALVEPKCFEQFIKIEWKSFLHDAGFRYEGTEIYMFTKLIIAVKE